MTNPPHHFRRTTHSARALQPYIVWGAPGCAKSQSHSSSRLYGHEYIDVRALLPGRSAQHPLARQCRPHSLGTAGLPAAGLALRLPEFWVDATD